VAGKGGARVEHGWGEGLDGGLAQCLLQVNFAETGNLVGVISVCLPSLDEKRDSWTFRTCMLTCLTYFVNHL
jgi:hypothetical protein